MSRCTSDNKSRAHFPATVWPVANIPTARWTKSKNPGTMNVPPALLGFKRADSSKLVTIQGARSILAIFSSLSNGQQDHWRSQGRPGSPNHSRAPSRRQHASYQAEMPVSHSEAGWDKNNSLHPPQSLLRCSAAPQQGYFPSASSITTNHLHQVKRRCRCHLSYKYAVMFIGGSFLPGFRADSAGKPPAPWRAAYQSCVACREPGTRCFQLLVCILWYGNERLELKAYSRAVNQTLLARGSRIQFGRVTSMSCTQ
ncbi:hypothetical protein GN956_G11511 [Arapaima gigas]